MTGLNNVRVVASGGNGYATASNYQLVITTGTVNSVSVVGEVIAEFSIENRRADVQFWNGTQVATPATAGIPDVNVKNINNAAAATPGASGGILIAGSNAATTIAGLTTGAIAATTITASGAVAFQSTFAVTTSTALGAVSGSTLTMSGAVAFQSTFAVTTSTSLGALSATTFATSGTTTFNALTVTNNLLVSGTTTHTGATTFTGAITASNASNAITGIDVVKVAGSAPAATNLNRGTRGTVLGTVGSASTTTSIVTSSLDPAAAATDQFKGRIVTFERDTTTTNLQGQATDITGSSSLGVLTCTALTDAPVSGDTFVVT